MFAFWWGMRRVLPTVIQIQGGGLTLKYKVSFSGFAYVEADSPEEAEEKAMYEDDAVYEEKKCESVEEVDEFTVSLENCMERLTYWNEEYGCLSYHGPSGEAAKRLAAYEETGLEPEAVEHLKLASMGKAIAEIKEFDGVPIDRLRELAQADRDGKLPKYTIGDTVYDRFGDAWEVRTEELHLLDGNPNWIYRCGHAGTDDYCALWEFKILPREEAEAALRREQDGE